MQWQQGYFAGNSHHLVMIWIWKSDRQQLPKMTSRLLIQKVREGKDLNELSEIQF